MKDMLIRIMSGVWYIALLVVVYCLKIFVPPIGGIAIGDFAVDIMVYVFSLIGTFEMIRALKDRLTEAERKIAYGFAVACIPLGVVMKYFLDWGVTSIGFCIVALTIILFSLTAKPASWSWRRDPPTTIPSAATMNAVTMERILRGRSGHLPPLYPPAPATTICLVT